MSLSPTDDNHENSLLEGTSSSHYHHNNDDDDVVGELLAPSSQHYHSSGKHFPSSIRILIQQTGILSYKNLKYKASKPWQTVLALLFPIQLVFIIWFIINFVFEKDVTTNINNIQARDYLSSTNVTLSKNIYLTSMESGSLLASRIQNVLQTNGLYSNYNADNTPIKYLENYEHYLVDIHVKSAQEIVYINRTNSVFKNQLQEYEYYMNIQKYINVAIFNTKNANTDKKINVDSIMINSRQLPKKNSVSEGYTLLLSILYPLYFGFSILNFFNPNLISIVTEKQSKIKLYLILMGCHQTSYVLSYFISCLLEIIILVSLTYLCLLISSLLNYVNLFLICILFFAYLVSGIPLIMITSSMFEDPKKALFFSQISFMVMEFVWIIYRLVGPLIIGDDIIFVLIFEIFEFQLFQYFVYYNIVFT